MTPVERLAKAAEKLERLRSERGYVEHGDWLAEPIVGDTARWPMEGPREDLAPVTNDELIVMLHRTIDAQLAIIQLSLDRGRALFSGERRTILLSDADRNALALADAILGSES